MNNKKWNRVLTGAATVALAIGTLAPMAFAATGSSGVQYNTRTISVGSGYTAVIQGVVASDNGTMTEFLPIYYLNQGLGKLGYTVSWNGNTRTLSITTPAGVTVQAPTTAVGAPGANQMVIEVNGTAVQLAPRQVAKDPATGVYTTYAPIYYLNNALSLAGFTNTYNSQGWTVQGPAASQSTTAGLSNITVTNATSGAGSSASPAVSLNGAAMTLSTTLTDANGNPISNTAVTFNFTENGTLPNGMPLPSVANSSGTFIAPVGGANAEQYTLYTNASGVASITVTGPSGTTYAYEVQATAPYAGANGGSVSSQPAYMEFVSGNNVGLSPYGTYNAAFGSSVPITVTLPPNSAGQPQANELITISTNHGAFTNSSGANLGPTVDIPTNSAGIAQTWLTDSQAETDTVSVTLPSGLNLTKPTSVNVVFAQAGVPANIQNYSITSTSLQTGQNVTVFGTVVDASGNPVPNGQVLVVGNDSGVSGDFGYVTGSGSSAKVTDFPNVGGVSSGQINVYNGTNASSATGDVVTADAAGNFSFIVTDTHDTETATFSIYAVANGQVVNSTTSGTGSPLKSGTITFKQGSTLTSLSLAGNDQAARNNTYTAATGFDGQEGGSSSVPIFVDPQNAAGNPMPAQDFTYNVTVDNGGAVNKVAAPGGSSSILLNSSTGLSSFTINENYTAASGSASANYTVTVPGATGNGFQINAANADLELYVINGNNTGNTTLTVSSGSVKSTAVIDFGSGSAAYVQNLTPTGLGLNAGQYQSITYQVQDTSGNPVPDSLTTIQTESSDPLWITQVNGVTLQQNEPQTNQTGASLSEEPTPIPLSGSAAVNGNGALQYGSVVLSGVVTWNSSNANQIQVYSNGSGDVTLTLQDSGVSYWANKSGTYQLESTTSVPASENVYTYDAKGDGMSAPSPQLMIGPNAQTTSSTPVTNKVYVSEPSGNIPQNLGTITAN